MKTLGFTVPFCLVLICLFGPLCVLAQPELPAARLFDSDEILDLELSGPIREMFNRRLDDTRYYPMQISYGSGEEEVSIELKVKTRGNFRRQPGNCTHPPILLNFAKAKTPSSSLFAGQDKLKLVTPCRGEEYVVREYLVYRLFELVGDYGFKARLVRVRYRDVKREKVSDPLYGIILEDQHEMAARLDGEIFKRDRMNPKVLDREEYLKMAVFQYLIGNTDWSVQYLHNVKFLYLAGRSRPVAVPYDFDHAGIVRAPYAKPAEPLELDNVRQRRYRGYCLKEMDSFAGIFARFNELKEVIYELYRDAEYLDEKARASTLAYLDEFYDTINDAKRSRQEFLYPCDPNGTGHIVIQGLPKTKKKGK